MKIFRIRSESRLRKNSRHVNSPEIWACSRGRPISIKNPAGVSEGLLNTNNKTIECKKCAKEFACGKLCHTPSLGDSRTFHNLGFEPVPYWVFWLWVRLRETAVVTVIHFKSGIVFYCQLIDWLAFDTVVPETRLTCSYAGRQYVFEFVCYLFN